MTRERSRFRIRAELAEISEVRRRFGAFCEASPAIDERMLAEVTLAVDEAATNIARHAYDGTAGGFMDVEFELTDGAIWIRLWDDGIQRDESDCVGLPPGTPGEGGMGLNLMRAMLTSIDFRRDNGRNLLVLRRDTISRGDGSE